MLNEQRLKIVKLVDAALKKEVARLGPISDLVFDDGEIKEIASDPMYTVENRLLLAIDGHDWDDEEGIFRDDYLSNIVDEMRRLAYDFKQAADAVQKVRDHLEDGRPL